MIDASLILPRLYQGAAPPPGAALKERGFDVLVLTAREYQPPDVAFPGVRVLRAPLDDEERPLSEEERISVIRTAREAASALEEGKRVLVTCAQGRNRSGLLSAIIAHMTTGAPGWRCAEIVSERRPGALTNRAFRRTMEMIP
jgi:protein-tyrosine phosphatase